MEHALLHGIAEAFAERTDESRESIRAAPQESMERATDKIVRQSLLLAAKYDELRVELRRSIDALGQMSLDQIAQIRNDCVGRMDEWKVELAEREAVHHKFTNEILSERDVERTSREAQNIHREQAQRAVNADEAIVAQHFEMMRELAQEYIPALEREILHRVDRKQSVNDFVDQFGSRYPVVTEYLAR